MPWTSVKLYLCFLSLRWEDSLCGDRGCGTRNSKSKPLMSSEHRWTQEKGAGSPLQHSLPRKLRLPLRTAAGLPLPLRRATPTRVLRLRCRGRPDPAAMAKIRSDRSHRWHRQAQIRPRWPSSPSKKSAKADPAHRRQTSTRSCSPTFVDTRGHRYLPFELVNFDCRLSRLRLLRQSRRLRCRQLPGGIGSRRPTKHVE